jgi:hypothetical protein
MRARAANRTQARSAIFWGLGTFILMQAALAVWIDNRMPDLRDPLYENKAARLRERVVGVPARPLTVVMLGSSRTVFALKATELEGPLEKTAGRPVVVFNFGVTGAGPVTNLMNQRRLLAEGVRPDLFLIEVLPPLLADYIVEADRLPADRLWRSDLELLERYDLSNRNWEQDWWLASAVPSYSHRFAIMSRVAPTYHSFRLRQDWFRECDGSGWIPSPAPLPVPRLRAAALENARREYAGGLAAFHLGGPSCQALREQLEVCRQENISAALVLLPEGTDFRSWYKPADWAEIERFLGELSREYGAPVVNAREWIADEDFSDSHHLLASGAEKFTQRLGREVLPALLADKVKAAGVASR